MASFNIPKLKEKARNEVRQTIRKSMNYLITADNLITEHNEKLEKKLTEQFDIFLSHSSKDAEIVLGLVIQLTEMGYSVYVDWIIDNQLDRNQVTKKTAKLLKIRMTNSKCLFYATTDNATNSKWMPWELGFMDGQKDKVAILPIFQKENYDYLYKGQEYLGIYPYVVKTGTKGNPNKDILFIFEDVDIYAQFDEWLKGEKPKKRV